MYLLVGADYETSERAGQAGAFQITSLHDADGRDLVKQVDQGMHFNDAEECEKYLEKIFGKPVDLEFDHETVDPEE